MIFRWFFLLRKDIQNIHSGIDAASFDLSPKDISYSPQIGGRLQRLSLDSPEGTVEKPKLLSLRAKRNDLNFV